MKCPGCDRDFPEHLLSDLVISTTSGGFQKEPRCPLCALATINTELGLPADTQFEGSKAREMYREAVEIVRARKVRGGTMP